ncbi:MAG: polyprenyl synthetase family protein [Christensenellales bacterium]
MKEYDMKYEGYRQAVELSLAGYLNNPQAPKGLMEAMRYSAMAGGKRFRPILTLAANTMLGGDPQEAMPIACAIEMIHTYALIHDDLPGMDNDDLRRGMPTSHIKFGEGNAILAGDGLLSYGFEVMLNGALTNASHMRSHLEAIHAVAVGAGVTGMVAGQFNDLANEGGSDFDELKYIHAKKTGALITASLKAGALLCSPLRPEIEAITSYGDCIGLAFQITDDILDVTGSKEKLGKSIGKDKASDKLTYAKLFGVEKSKKMAQEKIDEAVSHLGIFGEKAVFLQQLAARLISRES